MSGNHEIGLTVDHVRETKPLVHCITNYVTVQDCANALLAVGASPVMADERAEVAEITKIAQGLLLNIGTLNKRIISSMRLAARTAKTKGIPIVLDPVGAGASALRTGTARELIRIASPAVIRGNASEIASIYCAGGFTRGVDAAEADAHPDAMQKNTSIAVNLSRKTGAIVIITGAVDILTDGKRVITVHNGHPLLSRITGSGCMLSCILAAYCAAAPDRILEAGAAAVAGMGIAGEEAAKEAGKSGTGSFRISLFDSLSRLSTDSVMERMHCEEYI